VSRPELWLIFVLMGLVTVSLRASFMLLQDRLALPNALERALRYVPAAVLAAILTPALFRGAGEPLFGVGWFDTRVIAALIAALVAWRTKNILATITAGMVALWVMAWLLP
jgi:branched-subunit amino acid transport protein